MNRLPWLHFESLEARKVLSAAHPASAAAPLVLDGTLALNNRAAMMVSNLDGSTTTTVPVSGRLAGLGAVHGAWNETVDAYGIYEGPDTIQLRDPQGGFTVAFSNESSGPAHRGARGSVYYEHNQRVQGGTRAYAGAREFGTIDLNENASHTSVQSMTLNTTGA